MLPPAPRSPLFPYTTLFRSLFGPFDLGLLLFIMLPSNFLILLLFLRSEEHTSELQSRFDLVCRLLLDNKNATGTSGTAGTSPATGVSGTAGDAGSTGRRRRL